MNPRMVVSRSPSLGLCLKPVFVFFGAALATSTFQPTVFSTHRRTQDLVLPSWQRNAADPARNARFSCSYAYLNFQLLFSSQSA